MSKNILSVPLCSHNPTTQSFFIEDTARLADLFLMVYQYHLRQPEPEAEQFITLLQQLVRLGYKACRHYPHNLTLCKLYRNQFLQYDNGDFRKHLSILGTLAKNLAKMVQLVVESYQELKHPDGYEAFFVLLETILNPEKLVSVRQQEYAYQLLEELRQLA